ncbi:MAG: hypothetical protein CVV44_10630 [Spirochaetae bacterium HGW-Spirochaetae-1]|jgi:uncharacterized RDD family membrane protein YckC|nr:MAG: hypothetical protein CVV44_10630 [Spirochaetae bacterium HGW-Spirochaetae-1]
MEMKYPTILRRYLSSFIDGILLLVIFFLSLSLIEGKDQVTSTVRFILPIVTVILYEPLLTSKACTFGQLLTGIRVRKIADLKKISVFSAYMRYTVKFILGFISFFSIIFSDKSRAIHDFSSGSIVVNK